MLLQKRLRTVRMRLGTLREILGTIRMRLRALYARLGVIRTLSDDASDAV